MRLKIFCSFALAILLFTFCTPTKQINQLKLNASEALEAQDYKSALIAYQEIIDIYTSRRKDVPGEVYRNAGFSAWELKNTEKAIGFLEKAKQTPAADQETIFKLALCYLEIDNLSKEITNLEIYTEQYHEGDYISKVHQLLFLAYVKSVQWEKADNQWEKVDDSYHSDVSTLVGYLKVLKSMGQDEDMIPVAKKIVDMDSSNVDALEILAESYYRKAEENYKKEMRLYEKNRTNKQYRILLAELEKINANFRTSRDYFERLFKINPEPRYATFLGNIYTRFDNKKKAEFYYSKSKESN